MSVGADGWPVGEKRYHCANCGKAKDGKPSLCGRKKRVGIGFCRDHSALKGNNESERRGALTGTKDVVTGDVLKPASPSPKTQTEGKTQ